MSRTYFAIAVLLLLVSSLAFGQVDKIVIPAGTPEDQALNAINSEQDAQKRLAMYQDFLEKFASNPVAVAYGNWQLAQYYQTAGDLQKASEYGDKATAAASRRRKPWLSTPSVRETSRRSASSRMSDRAGLSEKR